jgi:hypothetical protein
VENLLIMVDEKIEESVNRVSIDTLG